MPDPNKYHNQTIAWPVEDWKRLEAAAEALTRRIGVTVKVYEIVRSAGIQKAEEILKAA